jgi:signal transduction histidine kinase
MKGRITPAAVLDAIDVGVVVQDAATRVVFANAAAAARLGVPVADLLGSAAGDPRWQGVTPEESPVAAGDQTVRRAISTGQPARAVITGRTPASGRASLQVVSTPALGADGAVSAVFTTLTELGGDHTSPDGIASEPASAVRPDPEGSQADTLEAHRAMLDRVTDAVPGVLYRHLVFSDRNDAFDYVSGQALDVLGIEASEVCRSADVFWSRVHPDDAPAVRAAIADDVRALRLGRAGGVVEQRFDEEFRFAMPDGAWRWLRAQSLSTLVGDDMVCHGVITDVTERRLLAEQLRVSQRQELIGVMVSGVAHNFNNMLAAIVPNLERARQQAIGELQHEIADAYDASKSAADLVRALMLLVRHDEARAAEPLDVVTLVHDVMRMCRRTFDQRIVLETITPAGPLVVMGRRSELQQVVLNLCINARDAVEAVDAPLITVQVQELAGGRVAIDVRDSGVGMDEQTARRVGQPFFTTKAPGKGTGLGIATAIGIVSDMAGELTWASQPGDGSDFRISLPLAPGARSAQVAVAAAPPARRRFDGQVALVIDDEPLVRKTLGRLLAGLGLTALLASTGEEGVDLVASREDIAVVLLDLSMPGMSGPEALQRIAQLRPRLPVFVVSGWVAEPAVLETARGVLPKPFTSRQLADTLAPVFDATP